jgi:hypothetical protein
MRAPQSVTWSLIAWMFCSPLVAVGQTSSSKRPAPKKTPTAAEQIAALSKQVQEYQAQLVHPDVASDPYRSNKIKELWVLASCQLEVQSLPAPVIQDPKFVDGLYAALCSLQRSPAWSGENCCCFTVRSAIKRRSEARCCSAAPHRNGGHEYAVSSCTTLLTRRYSR